MVLTGPLVYLAMLPDIIILVVGYLCTGVYNRRAQVSQACCTPNSWPTSSRHLGSTPISSIDRICYSASELLSFRKKSPKQRLVPDLWQTLNEIGIRKSFRGKRDGSKKKQEKATPLQGMHPVLVCATGIPPNSPTGESQPARLFPAPTDPSVARIPTLLCSNTRSLVPKMIELQGVVDVNLPGFVSITETWLSPVVPDSAVHLSNYILFRRDRPTHAGEVCIFVDAEIPCSCLRAFEPSEVESIWVKARPLRLPRQVSMILVGTVYHPPSSTVEDNQRLLQHFQDNVESFLRDHPEGLIFICGDFNPTSTRITKLAVNRATGLSQIVKVNTRDSGTLDRCLTKHPKLMDCPKQLPKLGSTDHYSVLIHPPKSSSTSKNTKIAVGRRHLRASRIRDFSQWITQQSWDDVISTTLVNEKFDIFINTLKDVVDKFLPIKETYVYATDKPWITRKIKSLIAKRQKRLKFGKDSPAYKEARNAVQKERENSKKCFYDRKVAKLKQTNVRRWWKEIKGLTGLRCSESWVQQMLGDQLESTELLANSFNTFLAGLTADFVPLPQIIPCSFFPVPEHLLVDTRMV